MATPTTAEQLASALYNNQQNAKAGAQVQTGIQRGVDATQNMYGAQTVLDLPFIEAGASAGNAMVNNVQPYIGAGQNAIGNLQTMQQAPLNTNQFMDPSAQFTMQQGQQALERSAAARGGVLSGAAMKDLMSYSSGLASQNYNNAAQLALQDRNQRISVGDTLMRGGLEGNQQMQPIFQGGITSLQTQGNIAAHTGNNLANLYTAGGLAAGASTAGQQDTLSPFFKLLSDYKPQTTGGNTTGGV